MASSSFASYGGASHAKEIIYLSFGPYANHLTTHFFNQQESYFDYGTAAAAAAASSSFANGSQAKAPPSWIDHDTSFREGYSQTTRSATYTPRALLFDTRDEFGALRRHAGLYSYDDGDEEEVDEQGKSERAEYGGWTEGPAQVLRTAQKVRRSRFQQRLDAEELGEELYDSDAGSSAEDEEDDERRRRPSESTTDATTAPSAGAAAATTKSDAAKARSKRIKGYRFWSDYLRVHYHPRSLLTVSASSLAGSAGACRPMRGAVPSSASDSDEDSEAEAEGGQAGVRLEGFDLGYSIAKEMEREQEVLDENLRWLAEDSDLLQSFDMTTNTNDAFAGLGYRYLQEIRDEFSKTPVLLWGAAWGSSSLTEAGAGEKVPGSKSSRAGNRLHMHNLRSMNFAVHLALASEVASLYTPLCAPTEASALGPHLSERYDPRNMHHASALLSAHVETVTLPMRVRASSSDSSAGAPSRDSAAALIARLNWKRDTPIAALSGCFPTPLLAAAVAKPAIMDPIDALLAARGYAPKQPQQHTRERGSRETPEEIAQRAAGVLKAAWSDLSCARGILDPRAKPAPSFSAFGRALVARDGDAHAREITLQALEALLASSSPRPSSDAATSAQFAPLAFALPNSFPQFLRGLTSEGRSLEQLGLDPASQQQGKMRSLPLIASLSTSASPTYTMLKRAKATVTAALASHAPLSTFGLGSGSYAGGGAGAAASEDSEGIIGGRDGLKEVRERLEDLLSAYEAGLDEDEEEEDDGRGTDEEWQEDEEWDLE